MKNQGRKIHVCFVVDHFARLGGVQSIVSHLANNLNLANMTIEVLALKGNVEIPVRDGVRVLGFGSARMRQSLTKLKDHFKRTRPDLILASYEEVACLALAANILAGSRSVIIWWQHVHFTSQLTKASKTGLEIVVKYSLYFFAARFMKRFVAVSRGVQRDLTRALFLPAGRVKFMENPSMPIPIRPETGVKPSEMRPRFVFIGRLCLQKQVHHILMAIKMLPFDVEIQLDIIGEGEDRQALMEMASGLPDRHQVHFHGMLEQPWGAVKDKSVLILSSLFEGYPSVLLEAKSLGIPAISYNAPSGPSEIINDGLDGLLVPAQDTRALSDAIEKVWRDLVLYESLRAGAAQSSSKYDFQGLIHQFETFILAEAKTNIAHFSNS